MQLSTKWEIITRTLRYVLGSRNDNLLTIGGRVLAVPSIEHHLVGGLHWWVTVHTPSTAVILVITDWDVYWYMK